MKTFVILIISIVIMVIVQKVQAETSLAAISFSVLSGIGAFGFMYDKLMRN